MTLYLLLNLALIIIAAGVIPVLASQDDGGGDDSESKASASERHRQLDREARKEQELLNVLLKKGADALRAQVEERVRYNATLDETKTASEQRLELLSRELSTLKTVLAEASRKLGTAHEEVIALQAQVELLVKQEKALAASTNAANRFGESFDKLLGLSDEWNNSMLGGLLDALDAGRGLEGIYSDISKKMAKQMAPLRLIGNLLTKVQDATTDLAFAQDKVLAEVNKSTQAYGQYDDQIIDVNISHRTMGLGLERVQESFTALNNTMTTFDLLSKDAQTQIATTSGYLQTLGADAGVAAESMRMATSNLGMSAIAADGLRKEVAGLAGDLNIDLNKALGDFNANAPFLAQYGDDATKAFKELAIASDNLQIGMSRLVAIVDKFSTFEGAVNTAGKLNAALGGDFVNSIELMTASLEGKPVDALRALKEGIEAGGVSFDEMSGAQRRFITTSAGLESVGELAALLSGDLEKQQQAADRGALSQAELAKRTMAVRDVTEMWKDTLQSLAISMRPVMVALKTLVGWIGSAVQVLDQFFLSLGGAGSAIMPFVMGLVFLFKVFGPVVTVMGGVISTLGGIGTAAAAAGAGTAAAGASVAAATPVLLIGAKGLFVFGVAAATVAVAMVGIAYALSSLTDSFASLEKMGDIPVLSNLSTYASGLVEFASAAWLAKSDIVALGGALDLLGKTSSQFGETVQAVVQLEANAAGLPVTKQLVEQVHAFKEAEQQSLADSVVFGAQSMMTPATNQSVEPRTKKPPIVSVANFPEKLILTMADGVKFKTYIKNVVKAELGGK
jgi:hypothetical protein